MMQKSEHGNIYEILLSNNTYAYVCLIEEYGNYILSWIRTSALRL